MPNEPLRKNIGLPSSSPNSNALVLDNCTSKRGGFGSVVAGADTSHETEDGNVVVLILVGSRAVTVDAVRERTVSRDFMVAKKFGATK